MNFFEKLLKETEKREKKPMATKASREVLTAEQLRNKYMLEAWRKRLKAHEND